MSEHQNETSDFRLSSRPSVDELLRVVSLQRKTIQTLEARLSQLEAELSAAKKLKGKPKIKASRLNDTDKSRSSSKRSGTRKGGKKNRLEITETQIIELPDVPSDARFNGYRDYDVQELQIERRMIRFRLKEYVLADGHIVRAQLPLEYRQTGHFGPLLVSHILSEHYHNRVPHRLIAEQLEEWGIDISVGQINAILTQRTAGFAEEATSVLAVGLAESSYIHTDDTGARHQGRNGYCTVIGNEGFSYFVTSASKSRQNFLSILQGNRESYVLNDVSQAYLSRYALSKADSVKVVFSQTVLATSASEWQDYLASLAIVGKKTIRVLTEAALLGGAVANGLSPELLLLSDGAPQFNVLNHGLCWVHAERGLRKLDSDTEQARANIQEVQTLLWEFYQALKAYRAAPCETNKAHLSERFDQLFGRCYLNHELLNDELAKLLSKKEQLLRVLDYPILPLHNNAAESDIREYVTRRKISGGTRSEAGRMARDTFISLKKTCRKLGISFWSYLLARLRGDATVLPLPELLKHTLLDHNLLATPA